MNLDLTENLIIQRDKVIAFRALGLFFFNFKRTDIDQLCEKSADFRYVWNTYLEGPAIARHKKQKGMLVISHTDFYDAFFTKLSYTTQALIIAKAVEIHGKEVSDSFDLMIEIDKRRPGKEVSNG